MMKNKFHIYIQKLDTFSAHLKSSNFFTQNVATNPNFMCFCVFLCMLVFLCVFVYMLAFVCDLILGVISIALCFVNSNLFVLRLI